MSQRMALREVLDYAERFSESLKERSVGWSASVEELRSLLGGELPDDGADPTTVVADLIKGAEPGIVGTTSPRYFGFVIGGRSETALAADWLTSVWDQNAGLFVGGPSASVVEEVAGQWLKEILLLPREASVAFVTGTQLAHFTCLAAARHHLLTGLGWELEQKGLAGAPEVRIIASEETHVTVTRALRFLGFGTDNLVLVGCDTEGGMRADEAIRALEATTGPTILCLQAGNVNSGAFDPIGDVMDVAHERGAWVHIDGAFGLWAAASADRRPLVKGVERADSWSTDAHKWLNVPYDAAMAFCAHPRSHAAAIGAHASYLIHSDGRERDQMDWTPEFSRRARGFSVYAQLRALGRRGVSEVVDRCCACARRFADRLGAEDDVEVLNEVVLNQVLVRFLASDGDHDRRTQEVVKAIQRDGTLWLSGSVWHGTHVMRLSVSNQGTTEEDVDRSIAAILRIAAETP